MTFGGIDIRFSPIYRGDRRIAAVDLSLARQWPDLPLRSGALPYRFDTHRRLSLLMIRRSGRTAWWPPKGQLSPDLAPHETAATEAYEEAGVEGRIESLPLGSFLYTKSEGPAEHRRVEVVTYPLHVTRELARWPEAGLRERRWFTLGDAIHATASSQLADLYRMLGRQLAGAIAL